VAFVFGCCQDPRKEGGLKNVEQSEKSRKGALMDGIFASMAHQDLQGKTYTSEPCRPQMLTSGTESQVFASGQPAPAN
jgi:hypothetical protein